MKFKLQISLLVLLLSAAGLGVILYKHFVLEFPLLASKTQDVWQIEAKLSFEAEGGPVEAKLNMPDQTSQHRIAFRQALAPGFEFDVIEVDGTSMARWRNQSVAPGPVVLLYYTEVFFTDEPVYTRKPPAVQQRDPDDDEAKTMAAVTAYITELGLSGGQLVREVLTELNSPTSSVWKLLRRESGSQRERLTVAREILALQGINTREVRGVLLQDRQRNRRAHIMLAAHLDKRWTLFDPGEAHVVGWNRFLPYEEGGDALFTVSGGQDSRLVFSVIKTRRAAFENAVESARHHRSWLVDFSIYSLPIEQQSTFKLLLLIPLGALVVVILRNLVGIRTSGTFMPILIALAFLQTSLLTGLALFLIVVGVGLFVRSYLTHLNLLLVPRIASVLVFVIILYAAIGIASHKLGLEWGMKVTFFPMIILSWTIERMSILWDEEGPKEVMIQGGGSLLTASLAYLVMSNHFVADSIFLYPEALLILLAVIIAIGSYTGYRLSDLRRFEPMERYQ